MKKLKNFSKKKVKEKSEPGIDLDKLIWTKQLVEDIAASIRNIIFANFPELTPGEKEDIDQEVKLKIWRMAARGKKIRNFRSYLWKMVCTTALDVIEDRLNFASLEETVQESEKSPIHYPEPSVSASGVKKQDLKLVLETALKSLAHKRKAVLKMHLLGMSLEEIAKSLAWSKNKVRHLLYRGLNDLRERMR